MRGPQSVQGSQDCRTCTLRNVDFFCALNSLAFREFDGIKSLALYPRDALLFVEKDEARGVFVLCQGLIKLSMGSSEGKTLIMQVAKPGEVLGLTAAMNGMPYQATAQTLRPSQVAYIRRDDFLKFIKRHPEVYKNILKQLMSLYESACDQLRAVGLAAAPKRIARLLLDWSGAEQADRCPVRVIMPLTHEEIGEFVGSTRETVTRTLSDFKDRNLITLQGSALTIHNRKALEQIAVA